VHVTRLRSQSGFTLPELMVAMSISLMTLLGVLGVLDVSVKQTNAVAGRVNATQRSRIVMDTITRQLRSQVCYNATTPALVSATDDSVKFHVDLSDGATSIQQRELVFNPTTKTIRERTWPGNGLTPLAFPTMTRDRLLIEDVVRRLTAGDGPIFRYYAYNTLSPPQPKVLLPTPLNAADLARVAKIDIGFITLPPGVKSTPLKPAAGSVTLENEIYVRVADPNDPAPTPTCA
jgi:prepilin-type N-terminal cleavage/methylation domain-containing protein